MSTFTETLTALINRHSVERESNTPDFILAEYLSDCLEAFEKVIAARSKWYDSTSLVDATSRLYFRRAPLPEILDAEAQIEIRKVRSEADKLKEELSSLKNDTQWIQWLPPTNSPAFEGDYYCLLQVRRDDGTPYVKHMISRFDGQRWHLIPGLKLLFWTKTLQEP